MSFDPRAFAAGLVLAAAAAARRLMAGEPVEGFDPYAYAEATQAAPRLTFQMVTISTSPVKIASPMR